MQETLQLFLKFRVFDRIVSPFSLIPFFWTEELPTIGKSSPSMDGLFWCSRCILYRNNKKSINHLSFYIHSQIYVFVAFYDIYTFIFKSTVSHDFITV